MTTHEIRGMTVVAVDEYGEASDLNAGGEPCRTADDLRAFVAELRRQGYYGAETERRLLAEVR